MGANFRVHCRLMVSVKIVVLFAAVLLWGLFFPLEEALADGGGAAATGAVKIMLMDKWPCIISRDAASAVTVVKLFVNGGRNADSRELRGLSYMTSRLCIEIPSHDEIRKMMDMGSSFDVSTEGDFSVITLTCLSRNFEETVEILGGIVRSPLFSQLRQEHIRSFMESRIKSEEDNLERVVFREALALVFGDSGYGGSGMGDEKTLKNIRGKDIEAFYKNYFNMANITLAVVSDLEPSKVESALVKRFGGLPRGVRMESSAPVVRLATDAESRRRLLTKDTQQRMIAMVYPLPAVDKERYACAHMANVLLGDGVGSRLWPIRMKMGLAYDVDADLMIMKHAGLLAVHVKTDADGAERAKGLLEGIMKDIYENGFTSEELASARIRAAARFWRRYETKEERAHRLGVFESLGLGYEFAGAFSGFLDSVAPETFAAFVKTVFNPGNCYVISVGPKSGE